MAICQLRIIHSRNQAVYVTIEDYFSMKKPGKDLTVDCPKYFEK